jgi:hypothetical protein
MNIFLRLRAKLFPKTGVYRYKDYKEYVNTQIQTNMNKLTNTWASPDNIRMLSEYIKNNITNYDFGICHGTRRGDEQKWFKEHLNCHVIGTEISPSATEFPNTIQWDFNEVKDEWLNNVDFIYSNSFDHAFNPETCLDAWMSCIKKNGICIIEWTVGHVEFSKEDPFGATFKGYKKLFNNKYHISDILEGSNVGSKKDKKAFYFIIQHKS